MTSPVNYRLDRARTWYGQADAKRWQVAWIAYHVKSRHELLNLADAINRGEDTVRNLSDAYKLFVEMVKEYGFRTGSEMRRKFPYTRWCKIYRQWMVYEFDIAEAKDWLENFEGGNDALEMEIDNKHGSPEWERRASWLYRQASKLQNDFGVPKGLQEAAANYVKEFDKEFPKVKK